MDKNKENVPKIRFPEFEDPWEQREFGELINETRNKTKIENEDILLSSAIDGMYLNSELFNHQRGKSNIGYIKVKRNDLVLSAQNLHLGNANVNFRFEHGIVSPAYKVYSIINANPSFFDAWLKRDSTKEYFLNATTEGASACRKNIEWKELYKQNFYIPNIEEQKEIGVFFKKFNNLINLHQRKLEYLQDKKKGLLQKMFPKEGEKFPEIRFPGFTDPWEQHKLGGVSSSFEYGLNAAAKEFDGKNKYIRITDIDDETRLFSTSHFTSPDTDLSNAENYILKKGDIVFARTGASVGKSYIYRDSDGLVYYAGFLIRARIKPEYDADFIFQNTLTKRYEKFINIISQRSGQPGVNAQEYATYEILLPKYDEQVKISIFFNKLDNLITLHHRKLEHLQQQKKGLLQQMFI